jgi:hypothetical protein
VRRIGVEAKLVVAAGVKNEREVGSHGVLRMMKHVKIVKDNDEEGWPRGTKDEERQ